MVSSILLLFLALTFISLNKRKS
ncbi:MAG TPA: hypothetical protein DCR60_07600 [Psychrobacter sp.]|nr:hypothetical protein [Psychrobacter sp.]